MAPRLRYIHCWIASHILIKPAARAIAITAPGLPVGTVIGVQRKWLVPEGPTYHGTRKAPLHLIVGNWGHLRLDEAEAHYEHEWQPTRSEWRDLPSVSI